MAEKYDKELVNKLVKRRNEGVTYDGLCKEFKLPYSTVTYLLNQRVPKSIRKTMPTSKYPMEIVEKVIDLREKGGKYFEEIATELNIPYSTAHYLYTSWKVKRDNKTKKMSITPRRKKIVKLKEKGAPMAKINSEVAKAPPLVDYLEESSSKLSPPPENNPEIETLKSSLRRYEAAIIQLTLDLLELKKK